VDNSTKYIYDPAGEKYVVDQIRASLSRGNSSEDGKRFETWAQCRQGINTLNKGTFYKNQIATLHNEICQSQVNQEAITEVIIKNFISFNEIASVLPRGDDVLEYKVQLARISLADKPETCPAAREFDQGIRDELTGLTEIKVTP